MRNPKAEKANRPDKLANMTREFESGWRVGFAEAAAIAANEMSKESAVMFSRLVRGRGEPVYDEYLKQLKLRGLDPWA